MGNCSRSCTSQTWAKIGTSRILSPCQTHLIFVAVNPFSESTILLFPLIILLVPLWSSPAKILWQPLPVCWTMATFLIPLLNFSPASWKFFAVPSTWCSLTYRAQNIASQISSPSIPYHNDLLAVLIKEVKMVAVLLASHGESFNLTRNKHTTATWEILLSMAQKVFWYQKEFALV